MAAYLALTAAIKQKRGVCRTLTSLVPHVHAALYLRLGAAVPRVLLRSVPTDIAQLLSHRYIARPCGHGDKIRTSVNVIQVKDVGH